MESKPTIEKCLEVIRELNKDIPQSEELIKHKANWLYMLNRLDFWQDMPVLLELIKYKDNGTK